MGFLDMRKALRAHPGLAKRLKAGPGRFPVDMMERINAAFSKGGDTAYPGIDLAATKKIFDQHFTPEGSDYKLGLIMPVVLGWTDLNWHLAWKLRLRTFGKHRMDVFEKIIVENMSQKSPWEIALVKNDPSSLPDRVTFDKAKKRITLELSF